MPDPRLELTAQDLIYAATALRAAARRTEERAADPTFHASKVIFEDAARAKDELARKMDRVATALSKGPRRV
jgi:hypothetical protein